MSKIAVIHGPNLNLLGKRNPENYGRDSLEDINTMLRERAKKYNIGLNIFQSNHEGKLIDKIHQYSDDNAGLIINPGGLTHYSVSLRDALEIFQKPIIEVHLSNILGREDFRRRSLTSQVVKGVITGLGSTGYVLALDALIDIIKGGYINERENKES
ncbi:MAG: type II 3-dehydroquinate dehydratase [Bacillota bacterium]